MARLFVSVALEGQVHAGECLRRMAAALDACEVEALYGSEAFVIDHGEGAIVFEGAPVITIEERRTAAPALLSVSLHLLPAAGLGLLAERIVSACRAAAPEKRVAIDWNDGWPFLTVDGTVPAEEVDP